LFIPDISLTLNTAPTTHIPVTFPIPMFGTAFGNFDLSKVLAAGSYILTIAGTGSSMTFGTTTITSSYGGSVSLSPVPIPGSFVLFASAGMGLLGFWGWSKRRKGSLGSSSLEAAAC